MTQYQITPEQIYALAEKVVGYHEIQARHRAWIPTVIKDGLDTLQEIWYTTEQPGVPIETKPNVAEYKAYITALKQASANVVMHIMHSEIPWADVKVSQKNPTYSIQNLSNREIIRTMARKESYFAFQGSSTPSINGLFGGAGNTSTSAAKWATAPGAHTVVADMKAALVTDGYFDNLVLTVSDPLANALDSFINATPVTDITQGDAVNKLLKGGSLFIEKGTPASPDAKVVYPLPAPSSNDGVALLCSVSPDNFQLIIEHPLETIVGPLNQERMAFPVTFLQCMSFRIWDANSICKHADVDLA